VVSGTEAGHPGGVTQVGNSRTAAVVQRLRAEGGRRTPGRIALLTVLADAPSHLTTAELHRLVQANGWFLDVSAVHRALVDFTEFGITHSQPTVNGLGYGLADQPHHHAQCTTCGLVTDIPADTLVEALNAATASTRFDLRGNGGLLLIGRGPCCQQI